METLKAHFVTETEPIFRFTSSDMTVIFNYIEAVHGVKKGAKFARHVQQLREYIFRCIDCYGNDDVPDGMMPVEYWLGHFTEQQQQQLARQQSRRT